MLSIAKITQVFLLSVLIQATGWAASSPRDKGNSQQMYPGASMTCLMTNDFYAVHFTALQPGRRDTEATDFVKYCQDIPAPGKTYLSVDLLDRESRKLALTLRLVEEQVSEDGTAHKILTTLKETPPKVYKNGVADIHAELDHVGHYALIITFGDESEGTEDDRLRIPFRIGLPDSAGSKTGMGALAAMSVMGFVIALLVAGYLSLFGSARKKRIP